MTSSFSFDGRPSLIDQVKRLASIEEFARLVDTLCDSQNQEHPWVTAEYQFSPQRVREKLWVDIASSNELSLPKKRDYALAMGQAYAKRLDIPLSDTLLREALSNKAVWMLDVALEEMYEEKREDFIRTVEHFVVRNWLPGFTQADKIQFLDEWCASNPDVTRVLAQVIPSNINIPHLQAYRAKEDITQHIHHASGPSPAKKM